MKKMVKLFPIMLLLTPAFVAAVAETVVEESSAIIAEIAQSEITSTEQEQTFRHVHIPGFVETTTPWHQTAPAKVCFYEISRNEPTELDFEKMRAAGFDVVIFDVDSEAATQHPHLDTAKNAGLDYLIVKKFTKDDGSLVSDLQHYAIIFFNKDVNNEQFAEWLAGHAVVSQICTVTTNS